MKTIPHLTNLIGLKVKHGSPGYEELDAIKDADFNSSNRVRLFLESGFVTNMTEEELDKFMEEGEIHYSQHFSGPKDTGLCILKLAEY